MACIAAVVVAMAACSSSGTGHAAHRVALPPPGHSLADLRAAARAWADAFFFGTYADIRALQGPECVGDTTSTISDSAADVYLTGVRTALARHLGRPLAKLRITGVQTRHVTATTGEALVEYDVPAAVAGNDNWVEFAVHDNRWLVADCHAPIGGESSSKSGTATTPP